MLFTIHHTTTYTYSKPVFLEPHVLRLRPRENWMQQVERFNLSITPGPAGVSHGLGPETEPESVAWFNGVTESLVVQTEMLVRTHAHSPFAYLPEPEFARLPLQLAPAVAAILTPCITRRHAPPPGLPDPVAALAHEVADTVDRDLPRFLLTLCEALFTRLDKVIRLEPGVKPPERTLGESAGACRDTALVFIEACRTLGIPARFVSGYQEGDPEEPERDLHAWAEAYVPGGGWKGFDPTHGLAVADRHVALCHSAEPERTSPVHGAFRGTGARASLSHRVLISMSS